MTWMGNVTAWTGLSMGELGGLKTRVHGECVQYSRIDVRKFFFLNRVVLPWNSLNPQPEDSSCVRCFRQLLDKTDFNKFLHFC